MKNDNRNNLKAHIVKIVAEKERVDERSVYRVLNGEQENNKVLDRYMIMKEYVEAAIVKAAKELVPITSATMAPPTTYVNRSGQTVNVTVGNGLDVTTANGIAMVLANFKDNTNTAITIPANTNGVVRKQANGSWAYIPMTFNTAGLQQTATLAADVAAAGFEKSTSKHF